MKKLILIILLASSTFAQEATLNTPVTRTSEAKYTVKSLIVSQTLVIVDIEVKDASNNSIRTFTVSTTDVAGLFTALDTVRATETGGVLRKTNFRILGFLADNAVITGVTLVP